MFHRLFVVFAAFSMAVAWLGAEDDRFAGSAQIVVVAAAAWESTTATLTRFERTARGWSAIDSWPVTLGHRGLGWGLGLHSAGPAGPEKREGDRRAPAGVFALESAFGTKAFEVRGFPWRRTDGEDLWIDDPESSHYNQWVRSGDGSVRRDWRSAEALRREDGLYDFAIVVGHNRGPVVKGRGSAIFLHAWSAPGRPTVGCTAMEKRRVRELVEWLDSSKRPLLVQAPREAAPLLALPDAILEAFDAPAASPR